MQIHIIDIAIIVIYLLGMIAAGYYVSHRASKNLDSYFLGGKTIPWYYLSVSNASGMFDIAGTMWLVYITFVYGMKSVFIPWIWPLFNQVFLMIYLAIWIRRSNVLTGAEWITTRFDQSTTGGKLAHLITVIFSIISIIGFLAYAFVGIGKFAAIFLPWDWSPHVYAIIITIATGIYVIEGGMFGVVLTDVIQYILMTISAIIIAVIAFVNISPGTLDAITPNGWSDIWIGWNLNLNWIGILDSVNTKIAKDGYSLFTIFIMMALFKGVFVSAAGPVATQALQRILASKTPKEAARMSAMSIIVVSIPRYLMVGGLTALALAYFMPQLKAMGTNIDFELILPFAINNFIPIGILGIVLSGMLSAHMSTVSAFINLAPAYIVNDIYKKYFKRDASDKQYVKMSYIISIVVTIVSIVFGLVIESVDAATQWIVSALWGGSAAANVLKWYWWRFNSYGYFWGMLTGLAIALLMPILFPGTNVLYVYPYILLISGIGSIAGTLLTPAENKELLLNFYTSVRPWGFWKPIKEYAKQLNPAFVENKNFKRDMFNIVIGAIWQISLMAAPLAFIIKKWDLLLGLIVVALLTSFSLKKFWYDRLEND